MSRRVILAAARVSTDRGVLASCLAWPEFDRLRRDGKLSAPAVPIFEGSMHG